MEAAAVDPEPEPALTNAPAAPDLAALTNAGTVSACATTALTRPLSLLPLLNKSPVDSEFLPWYSQLPSVLRLLRLFSLGSVLRLPRRLARPPRCRYPARARRPRPARPPRRPARAAPWPP